jgi:hypothetical protein
MPIGGRYGYLGTDEAYRPATEDGWATGRAHRGEGGGTHPERGREGQQAVAGAGRAMPLRRSAVSQRIAQRPRTPRPERTPWLFRPTVRVPAAPHEPRALARSDRRDPPTPRHRKIPYRKTLLQRLFPARLEPRHHLLPTGLIHEPCLHQRGVGPPGTERKRSAHRSR